MRPIIPAHSEELPRILGGTPRAGGAPPEANVHDPRHLGPELAGEIDIYGSLLPQDKDRIDYDSLESFINELPSDLLVRVKLERQTDMHKLFNEI